MAVPFLTLSDAFVGELTQATRAVPPSAEALLAAAVDAAAAAEAEAHVPVIRCLNDLPDNTGLEHLRWPPCRRASTPLSACVCSDDASGGRRARVFVWQSTR